MKVEDDVVNVVWPISIIFQGGFLLNHRGRHSHLKVTKGGSLLLVTSTGSSVQELGMDCHNEDSSRLSREVPWVSLAFMK